MTGLDLTGGKQKTEEQTLGDLWLMEKGYKNGERTESAGDKVPNQFAKLITKNHDMDPLNAQTNNKLCNIIVCEINLKCSASYMPTFFDLM